MSRPNYTQREFSLGMQQGPDWGYGSPACLTAVPAAGVGNNHINGCGGGVSGTASVDASRRSSLSVGRSSDSGGSSR